MTDPQVRCATCKYARFEMTNHKPPRINSNKYGACDWPIPVFTVALSVINAGTLRVHIWADMSDCPVWEGMAIE